MKVQVYWEYTECTKIWISGRISKTLVSLTSYKTKCWRHLGLKYAKKQTENLMQVNLWIDFLKVDWDNIKMW